MVRTLAHLLNRLPYVLLVTQRFDRQTNFPLRFLLLIFKATFVGVYICACMCLFYGHRRQQTF